MEAQDKPLKWRDAVYCWRSLSPLKRLLIAAPCVCWLAMVVIPAICTDWWLANDGTTFRLRWLLVRGILHLLFFGTLIGFVLRAGRQKAKRENE